MVKAFVRSLTVLVILAILAALLYGSYRLLRDTNLTVPSLFSPAPGKRALISMDGFHMIQSDDGKTTWSMRARSAELYETKEAAVKDVEIVLYYPDGRTAALIADEGAMDTQSGNGSVRGGSQEVRIVTSDGYLMTTESLFWKAAERVILTPSPFRVLGKEIYLEGRGMTANADLRKVVVEHNVKAVLQE